MAALGPEETQRWLERIDVKLARMSEQLDNLGFVRTDVYTAEKAAMNQRIEANKVLIQAEVIAVRSDLEKTQGNLAKFVWVVITAFVASAAALLFAGVPH